MCYGVMDNLQEQEIPFKQERIPVGCVPPACCPYLPACTAPGWCTCLGVYLVGVCTYWWGVPVWGCVPAWGCTYPGGVPARGCTYPGGTCPGTPPCEQTDRQVQKYYLAPNFVCSNNTVTV